MGKSQKNGQKNNKTKGKSSRQKHARGDSEGKSNDSPDIPDSGVERHRISTASQVEGQKQGVGGGGGESPVRLRNYKQQCSSTTQ